MLVLNKYLFFSFFSYPISLSQQCCSENSGRRRHGTTTTVTGTRHAKGYPLGAAQGHGVAGKARRGGDGIPDSVEA